MAIQQVTSGGGNGIMSFLFHDEGVMEGTMKEGAGFASTLRQLLGDPDAMHAGTDDAAPRPVLTLANAALHLDTGHGAALASSLEALASDFALPAQGAALPSQDGLEVAEEGQQHEQPFWGLAPFTNVTAALREHHVGGEQAAASITLASPSANAVAQVPAAPAFGKGIRNLIDLARDAEQLAGQLSQAAPLPAPLTVPASGMTAPAGGKALPQPYRHPASAVSLIASVSQPRGTPAAVTDMQPVPSDPGFDAALGTAFAVDAASGDARSAQGQATSAPAPVIQGLRGESILPSAPKPAGAADSSQATPLFDSPHLAGTEAWFEDLGTRVEWLNDMNIDRAELQLHPAELGLLEINIATGDDGTTVSFVTHNSEARELIEASMPKLRELLQNQGLQLGQSQVSQQSEGQRRGQDAQAGGAAPQVDAPAQDASPQRRTVYVRDPNRIDHYV